jgi:hypothetical protein
MSGAVRFAKHCLYPCTGQSCAELAARIKRLGKDSVMKHRLLLLLLFVLAGCGKVTLGPPISACAGDGVFVA